MEAPKDFTLDPKSDNAVNQPQTSPQPPYGAGPPPKKKKSPLFWLVLGLAVVAVCVGGFFGVKALLPEPSDPPSQEAEQEDVTEKDEVEVPDQEADKKPTVKPDEEKDEVAPPPAAEKGPTLSYPALSEQDFAISLLASDVHSVDALHLQNIQLEQSYPYRSDSVAEGDLLYQWIVDYGAYQIGILYPNPPAAAQDPTTLTIDQMDAFVWTKNDDGTFVAQTPIQTVLGTEDSLLFQGITLPDEISVQDTGLATVVATVGQEAVATEVAPHLHFVNALAQDHFGPVEDVEVTFVMANTDIADSITISGLEFAPQYDPSNPFVDGNGPTYEWGIEIGVFAEPADDTEYPSGNSIEEGAPAYSIALVYEPKDGATEPVSPSDMTAVIRSIDEEYQFTTEETVEFKIEDNTITFLNVEFPADIVKKYIDHGARLILSDGCYHYADNISVTGLDADISFLLEEEALTLADNCGPVAEALKKLVSDYEIRGRQDMADKCATNAQQWLDLEKAIRDRDDVALVPLYFDATALWNEILGTMEADLAAAPQSPENPSPEVSLTFPCYGTYVSPDPSFTEESRPTITFLEDGTFDYTMNTGSQLTHVLGAFFWDPFDSTIVLTDMDDADLADVEIEVKDAILTILTPDNFGLLGSGETANQFVSQDSLG